ncbi:MAG: ssDNA-binding protein [Candidatus Thorarchaeota archaeon]
MTDFIKSPVGRVSFPSVFEKTSFENSEPKYSVTLLFDADDPGLKKLKKLAAEAIKEKWNDDPPSNMHNPFRKGSEKPDLDGYEGKIFVKFSSTRKPQVMDKFKNELTDVEDFYAGCFAKVMCNTYAYDNIGRGVAFGLGHVLKVKDGDPFGAGSSDPMDDFADDFDDDDNDGDDSSNSSDDLDSLFD